jgi:glucose uptake protein GlcU
MAIESLVVLGLGTLFLLVLGLYETSHREEDRDKEDCKDHHSPTCS